MRVQREISCAEKMKACPSRQSSTPGAGEGMEDRIEPEAIRTAEDTASLPFVFKTCRAMPDVHLGKGATVGSVIATKGAICPAAVGVDIGCGMAARKTSIPSDRLTSEDLKKLRHSIEREIPVGRGMKKQPFEAAQDWMRAHRRPEAASGALADRALHQLGTLGGGNHFTKSVSTRTTGSFGLLLHSGSRNIGNALAEIHIERPRAPCVRRSISFPIRPAYFLEGTPDSGATAATSSGVRLRAGESRDHDGPILRRSRIPSLRGGCSRASRHVAVNCHHTTWPRKSTFGESVLVTARGRSGREKELGIIPCSMGTGSTSCRASEQEAFESAPHGAGRRMSRGEARRRSRPRILSARPKVSMPERLGRRGRDSGRLQADRKVIEKSSDLVEVVAGLKQIVCVKG